MRGFLATTTAVVFFGSTFTFLYPDVDDRWRPERAGAAILPPVLLAGFCVREARALAVAGGGGTVLLRERFVSEALGEARDDDR